MHRIRNSLILTSLLIFSGAVLSDPPHKSGGLPPGLQKKVSQGQSLPPGWQKKLQVGETLDPAVYRVGEVIYRDQKKGMIAIEVDNKVIRLLESTHEIIDVLDEF